jgi:hypothetical protein
MRFTASWRPHPAARTKHSLVALVVASVAIPVAG